MNTLIHRIFLILITIGLSPSIFAQGWIQLDDFPSTARDDGTSFTINSIAYCGTGLNSTWKFDLFLEVDELIDEAISIYPNPSTDVLTIQSSISTGKFHYHISSIQGTIVQSGELNFNQAINVGQLESGNYLILIESESKTYTKKLMIY